ncbi:ankyrin [Piromyces finnis]|uniref:Ankyrin n=1 Tax=Piromyces finnis TaxID=1754191 RepID=A0A1Y1VQS0_9FUNG|nr:ankyrin [Piromyces finnis]|eukprot:ORX61211.1 ankyrin [Piromyces finnis]
MYYNLEEIIKEINEIIYIIKNENITKLKKQYQKNKIIITPLVINHLIKDKNIKLLKEILKYYLFDNIFILKLISLYKSKKVLSKQKLCQILIDETEKVVFDKTVYEVAIDCNNFDIINILYNNDSRNKKVIQNEICKIISTSCQKTRDNYEKLKNNELKINYDKDLVSLNQKQKDNVLELFIKGKLTELQNINNEKRNEISINKGAYKKAIYSNDFEQLNYLYNNDTRDKEITLSEIFQILDKEEREYFTGVKFDFIDKVENGELDIHDEYFLHNLRISEKERRIILEYIRGNRVVELKNYINNNNISLSYFNDENFDLLIYAIENNSSIEMINYIILYYKSLNYTVFDDIVNKYKTPLLCAFLLSRFSIIKVLLQNGANINYEIQEIDIASILYKKNYLNNENFRFMINNGYKITSKLLSLLISDNSYYFLKIIFDTYFYKSSFILSILIISRNKIALSKDQLKSFIINEKTKNVFRYNFYDKALYYNNLKVLKMLYDYDGIEYILSLKNYKLCELLNEAIENNNYEFINKVLSSNQFNVKDMDVGLFLSKKFFSYEKLKSKLNIMNFFTTKLLQNKSFDYSILCFEDIIYNLRKIGSISYLKIFIKQSLNHRTFSFRNVNFQNLILIISEMYCNVKLMKYIIISSLNHKTFKFDDVNFENIISIINSGKFEDSEKIKLLKLFISKSMDNKTFDCNYISIKKIFQLNLTVSILEYFINKIFNHNQFKINCSKIEEVLISLNNIKDFEFSEYVIYHLFNHNMLNFNNNVNIGEVLLIASRLENTYIFISFIKNILKNKTLEFNNKNFEDMLFAISKMKNIVYIKMIMKLFINHDRFCLNKFDYKTINYNKIIRLANRFDNIYIIKWILQEFKNDSKQTLIYLKNILLYSSKIDNKNIMKFAIEKILKVSSLDSLKEFNDIDFFIINNINKREFSLILNVLIKLENFSLIKFFIENKELNMNIDINEKDENGDYLIITSSIITKAYENNIEIFKFLINCGANCNVKDINGNSLLLAAIKNKNYSIIKYLFKHNISIKSNINLNCLSLFDKTIINNDINLIKSLISNISNINKTKNTSEFTSLTLAYLLNYKEIFEIIKDDFDINELDINGYSLLHYAILKEDLSMIKYLIENGADVNLKKNKTMHGQSAIDICFKLKNINSFRYILESQTLSLNKLNENGETLLITLLKINNYTLDEKMNYMKYILQKDIDINIVDKYKKSAIEYAYELNSLSIIQLLLDNGAIFNNKLKDLIITNDIDDNSILLIKLLMNKNVITNTDKLFKNAIDENLLPSFKLLVDHDTITNSELILRYAIEYGDILFVEYLAKYNINYFTNDVIKEIIYKNKFNLLKMLIPKYLKVNRENENDLIYAIESENKKIVQYLINCGADINKCYLIDKKKCVPLMIAIKNENINMIKFLIEIGASSRNKIKNNSETLIFKYQNINILKYLYNKGIKICKFKDNSSYAIKFYIDSKLYNNSQNYLENKDIDYIEINNDNKDTLIELMWNSKPVCEYTEKEQYEILYKSVQNENINTIKELIDYGININEIYDNGDTSLIYSIKCENIEMIKFLIENGANPNRENDFGRTPISYAIEKENLSILKYLIENGAKFDTTNNKILLFAITLGNLDIIQYLIDSGANVNKCSNHGTTPLIYTIERNHEELVEFLIDNGANTNERDYYGHTPIIKAIVVGNATIVKQLLNHGANVNEMDNSSNLPLITAIKNKNIDIIKILIDYGVNTNESDKYGITPLIYSIKDANINIIKLLIKSGIDVEKKDASGETPLIYAIKGGNINVVKCLIKGGTNLNKEDLLGNKPLVVAYKYNNTDIIKCLIENGANDSTNNKSINMSEFNVSENIFSLFESNPLILKDTNKYENKNHLSVLSLINAIKREDIEKIKNLIDSGVDINRRNLDGCTPLFYAVKTGNLEITKYIIECGAYLNLMDRYGYTPLSHAIKIGSLEIVKYLIEKEIDINVINEYGYTPLIYAIKKEDIDIIKYLVKNGANINEIDKNVYTPLFYAIKKRNFEIIKYLIHHGADIHLHTRYSKTSLNYAIRCGDINIVKYLIECGADINPIGYWDFTPLTLAVYNREISIAKYLIDNNANINKKGNSYTPLIIAVKGSNINIIKYIIHHGGNLNETNEYNESPLTAAMENLEDNNFDLFKYLIECGADLNQFLYNYYERHRYDENEEKLMYCYRHIMQLID